MKCQRCYQNTHAIYRAFTDVLDMKVCPACAAQARELGILVELRRKRLKSGARRFRS